MTLILLYMGLILVGYMEHLVHICPIYEHNSPHVSVLYDLGMVLARVRRGARYQNSQHFKFFPISVEGGGHQKLLFPKFKKVQIMDFFHNFGHFFFEPSP